MATDIIGPDTRVAWGPRVDLRELPDLYAPQSVEPFAPPPAGIDNLGIRSIDTFMVPGMGEFTVEFRGVVRVARGRPTADDWTNALVYTNLIGMYMHGESSAVGPINVTLNPQCLSTGQLKTPFQSMSSEQPEKSCRMAVGALFHLPALGKTLFNKEPILLTIDHVRAIPPAGNPGVGRIYELLPLFDRDDPEGPAVAYITALDFVMGTYLSETEASELLGQAPS